MSDQYDFFATPAAPAAPPPPPTAEAARFGVAPLAGPRYPAPGYPPPGYPTAERAQPTLPRPPSVTAAAVIAFVQAGFAALIGVVVLVFARAIRDQLPGTPSDFGTFLMIFGLVLVVLAGLFAFFAYRMLLGAQWAAITIGVFQCLTLASAAYNLLDGGVGSALLGAALPGAFMGCVTRRHARFWLAHN